MGPGLKSALTYAIKTAHHIYNRQAYFLRYDKTTFLDIKSLQEKSCTRNQARRGYARFTQMAGNCTRNSRRTAKISTRFTSILEPDTVAMLEGVLDLPATKIREVMTPRTSMISLQEDDQLLDILHVLVESAHSRFPVFSSDQTDNVVGILLAKDLLPFLTEPTTKVDIRALMRQPLFVPESARSDQVLRMLKTPRHILP